MTKNKLPKRQTLNSNPFALLTGEKLEKATSGLVHVYGHGVKCKTDVRGHSTPRDRSPLELVLDATEGYIPLWAQDTILRWRFQDASLASFADPEAAKQKIRTLFASALIAWGDAVPIKFAEREDNWDFEISVRDADDCDVRGCTLASAFFPDGGQHELLIYPKLLIQPLKQQIDTFAHELGHIFGLRHFFALISERAWPAEVFGSHSPFSIMSYGSESELTPSDRSDLKELYRLVWSGVLTDINGTPIRLMRPYHAGGVPSLTF